MTDVIHLRDLIAEFEVLKEFPGLFTRKSLRTMRRNNDLRWVDGDEELYYPRSDIDIVVANLLRGKEPCRAPTAPSNTEASGSIESDQTGPGTVTGVKAVASAGAALAKGI